MEPKQQKEEIPKQWLILTQMKGRKGDSTILTFINNIRKKNTQHTDKQGKMRRNKETNGGKGKINKEMEERS